MGRFRQLHHMMEANFSQNTSGMITDQLILSGLYDIIRDRRFCQIPFRMDDFRKQIQESGNPGNIPPNSSRRVHSAGKKNGCLPGAIYPNTAKGQP